MTIEILAQHLHDHGYNATIDSDYTIMTTDPLTIIQLTPTQLTIIGYSDSKIYELTDPTSIEQFDNYLKTERQKQTTQKRWYHS